MIKDANTREQFMNWQKVVRDWLAGELMPIETILAYLYGRKPYDVSQPSETRAEVFNKIQSEFRNKYSEYADDTEQGQKFTVALDDLLNKTQSIMEEYSPELIEEFYTYMDQAFNRYV